jgi:drug/metabolite transporter (DMT)-like permease
VGLSRDRTFVAILLLLGASQGASYLFIRVAVRELSPPALMEIRLLFAAPLLVAYCLARGRGRELIASWRDGLAVGILGAAIPFTLIGWGERHVDSGVTGVANATVPIFVAIIAMKVLPGERATGLRLIGVLLGLGGVALLAGLHPEGGRAGITGTLAVVAAAPSYALATLYAQRRTGLSSLALAAGSLAWAAVVLLPFALLTLPSDTPSTKTIASVVVLGVVCTAASHALYYAMVSRHGASRSVLLTYVTPAFALLLGAWFLGEATTLAKLVGLALIIPGVALGAGVRVGSRGDRVTQRA